MPQTLSAGATQFIRVRGWCYHGDQRVTRVSLEAGQSRAQHILLGVKRPDVMGSEDQRDRGARQRSLFSGFEALLPLRGDPGRHVSVELVAELASGTRIRRALGTVGFVAPPLVALSNSARVAICLATYQPPADLLRKQIESIRNQSHEDWMCIVVDDGSDLTSRLLLRELVAKDERFVLCEETDNVGFYKNFERALASVPRDVEFVMLADQDDVWSPTKIEKLLAAFDPGTTLVYSDMRVVDDRMQVRASTYWTGRENNYDNLESLLLANTVTGAAAMFRREVLDKALPFPERVGEAYHDHWLALTAKLLGKLGYVDEPLYDYVQHGANVLGHHTGQGNLTRAREILREVAELLVGNRAGVLGQWEAIFKSDAVRLILFARTLRERVPEERDNRILRFYSGLEKPLSHAPRLGARALIRGIAGRNDTVGAEIYLLKALFWKMLLPVRARIGKPGASPAKPDGRDRARQLEATIDDMAAKIAPLRLSVIGSEPQRINLLVPSVDLVHFFGGYIAKFNLALALAKRGHRVRIVTVDSSPKLPSDWRIQLRRFDGLADFFDRVELVHAHDRSRSLAVSPRDRFVATTWWTAHIADAASRRLGRETFLYLIQEYEPFTFPMGSWAALADASYEFRHNALFSSELLRDYFREERLGVFARPDGDSASLAFENAITDVGELSVAELRGRTSRRLLFYARPEPHAARNMFELGALVLRNSVARELFDRKWEFHGIGATSEDSSMSLGHGRTLRLLSRKSQGGYAELLKSYDLGLCLMHTPHPSLVPLEMASAGQVVVTNAFRTKTAQSMSALSPNIHAAAPTPGSLFDELARAVSAVEDFDARVAGSQVRWSRSWESTFDDDRVRRIEKLIGVHRPPA